MVLICDSVVVREIWDKYHEYCCGRSGKLHSALPRAILPLPLVVFIPNFTPNHAITYTKTMLYCKLCCFCSSTYAGFVAESNQHGSSDTMITVISP